MFKIFKKGTFVEFFLAVTLIFFSLSHFTPIALGISLTFIILIVFFSKKKSCSINRSKFLWVFLFFLILNLFILDSSFFDNFYINNYIKFWAIQLFIVMFVFLSNYSLSINKLDNTLKIYLYIQITIFFVQLITYMLFDFYINFDELIRDENSYALYETKALAESFIPIRATGLYSEPSFYSMFVLVPAAYFLAKGQLNTATVLAIFTSFISLSIVSIICCILMVGFLLVINKRYKVAKLFMIIFIACLFPTIYTVYQLRVYEAVDYDAIVSRLVIVQELSMRSVFEDFVGSGFFWNALEPIGKMGMSGFHITDSSTYVYIYYCAGFVGLMMLIVLMLYIFSVNRKALFYLLCIMLFKFQILIGFFWLAIYLIGFKSGQKDRLLES